MSVTHGRKSTPSRSCWGRNLCRVTFDLAVAAGKFGEELQRLLDAVLPYEEGTDPELRVDRHPLLRLDFDREMHTAPGCHWNVHAERGAITNLLARNNPDHSGELCKLHLPVGGARMRPCLEDLLRSPGVR
jgi:hypothetical protein